jgi:hypothetical protein
MFDFTDASGNTNYGPYLSMFGGGIQAAGALNAASTNAALMRANAGVAGMQAQSAQAAGASQAQIYRQQLNQRMGKQAAFIGGSNVTTSGSALRGLESTAQVGQQDISNIQLNAARKAWGFQVQQTGDLARAGAEQSAGLMSGLGDLITSGSRAYGQWNVPTGND